MRRFEKANVAREWYGPWWRWFVVAWVLWWGVLYGKMVVQRRGGKLHESIGRLGTGSVGPWNRRNMPCDDTGAGTLPLRAAGTLNRTEGRGPGVTRPR
jgi:hypothetical protein